MGTVLNIVFRITCVALLVSLVGIIAGIIVDATVGGNYVANSDYMKWITRIVPIWLGGATVLWFYGFVTIVRGWDRRSIVRNLLLIVVLLLLTTLISPYYYWKRYSL